MSKFAILEEIEFAAPNYDLTTEDVVAQLQAWDQAYGIEIQDVADDAFNIIFQALPSDIAPLAQEIYQFCPDIVDQHFGCFDDALAMTDPANLDPEIQDLIADVDFTDPDFGLRLLEKFLLKTKMACLWWD